MDRSRLVALALVAAGTLLLFMSAAAIHQNGSMKAATTANRAAQASPHGQSAPSPHPSTSLGAAGGGTTFVIVMENRSFEAAMQWPYVASLAEKYALATNYHSISSPSLPNYLAMTSGSTWGMHDNSYRVLPSDGLGNQLTATGVSWRVYAEGFTGDCVGSPYPYAVKHNPFAYFGGSCPPNIVPFSHLRGDLSGESMPRLAWIIPDLCNDGHDCPSAKADRWLSEVVPGILNSVSWRNSGTMFLTWDEASVETPNRVPMGRVRLTV